MSGLKNERPRPKDGIRMPNLSYPIDDLRYRDVEHLLLLAGYGNGRRVMLEALVLGARQILEREGVAVGDSLPDRPSPAPPAPVPATPQLATAPPAIGADPLPELAQGCAAEHFPTPESATMLLSILPTQTVEAAPVESVAKPSLAARFRALLPTRRN